ncbi:unnamed protein product, partial [Hymenolepis diminuta]
NRKEEKRKQYPELVPAIVNELELKPKVNAVKTDNGDHCRKSIVNVLFHSKHKEVKALIHEKVKGQILQ